MHSLPATPTRRRFRSGFALAELPGAISIIAVVRHVWRLRRFTRSDAISYLTRNLSKLATVDLKIANTFSSGFQQNQFRTYALQHLSGDPSHAH